MPYNPLNLGSVHQSETSFLLSRFLHLVPWFILLSKLSIKFHESTKSSLVEAWPLSLDRDIEGEITRDVLPCRCLFKGEEFCEGFTEVNGVRSWFETVTINPPEWGLDITAPASFSASSFTSSTSFSASPLVFSSLVGGKPNLIRLTFSVHSFIAVWASYLTSYPAKPACILGHLPDRHRLLTHFFILLPGAS